MNTIAAAAPPSHLLDPERAGLHRERVYRAALRLTRSTHDAEDLAQETYVKVLTRPRVLREGDDLAYLLKAVRNAHLSAHRSAGRRPCTTVDPGDLERLAHAGADGDPHAAAVTRELLADIATLPPTQREVVVAIDFVGYSYAEAATAFQVPIGTVMSRLYRARAALSRS